MQPDKTDTWRDNTLKLSGLSLLVGDAAMFTSGVLKSYGPGKQKGALAEAGAGALWAGAGTIGAVYADPSKEMQLRILAHKLENYLAAHGARVSESMREHTELLHGTRGVMQRVGLFLHEYPSEMMNTIFAVGAGSLLYSGAVAKKSDKIMMGGFILAGALGGLLIKEDPDARKKAENGTMFERGAAFIQEKPLRFSSAMYMANDYFTFRNAHADMKEFAGIQRGLKPHYFSFLTATSYIFANTFMFMSPRQQIEDKKFTPDDVAKLEQVAAEIIGAQPKELQRVMLLHVSDYLAKEKSIPISPERLAEKLQLRVDEVMQRRTGEASERAWRTRHEAQKHAQANRDHGMQ